MGRCTWMGAALDRAHRPRAISLGASMTAIPLNRRLPGTFRRVIGLSAHRAEQESLSGTMGQNIACSNSCEPPVLYTFRRDQRLDEIR